MKDHPLSNAVGLIGDEIIAEASGEAIAARRARTKSRRLIALGALTALLFTSLLWLFVPYKPHDPSAYKNDPYFAVIDKLSDVFYENNYITNFGILKNISRSVDLAQDNYLQEASYHETSTGAENGEYIETTDNQVAGVVEGDLLKRSDKYAFYLRSDLTLDVYTVAGKASKAVVSALPLTDLLQSFAEKSGLTGLDPYYRTDVRELFLSHDCSKLTVLTQFWQRVPRIANDARFVYRAYLALLSIDVTDPAALSQNAIEKTSALFLSGGFGSARCVGDDLYLLTNFYAINDGFEDRAFYLPHYTANGQTNFVSPEDLIVPDEISSNYFTTVTKIDAHTLEIKDCKSLLGGAGAVYVSPNAFYLAARRFRTVDFEITVGAQQDRRLQTQSYRQPTTEIFVVNYADGSLITAGSFKIDGLVGNQYAMDEKDGILRVFTSTLSYSSAERQNVRYLMQHQNADLYCVDLSKNEIAASVRSFAPDGENVRSVRFDGDTAYVCTSMMLQDPVFIFDLSDLSNITFSDTGVIDGFSFSLVDFGDGLALGIGYGENWSFKIELYKKIGDKVEPICSYELTSPVETPTDYKAFFIDRANARIGFASASGTQIGLRYVYTLLHFDGEMLVTEASLTLPDRSGTWDSPGNARAFIDDGLLYVFFGGITVAAL